MATQYSLANEEHGELLRRLIDEHRPDLASAGAKIDLFYASNPRGRPLTVRGRRVESRLQITRLALRMDGHADAIIHVDGDVAFNLTRRQLAALLHRELRRIAPYVERRYSRDGAGRPRLRIRPADFEVDGFYETVAIFGEDAPEARALRVIAEARAQRAMAFATAEK